MKTLHLVLIAAMAAMPAIAGTNLLKGDTSAETEHLSVAGGDASWAAFGSFDYRYDRTTGYQSERSVALVRPGLVSLPMTQPLEAGKLYTFSFYAKAEKGSATIAINCYPADAKEWPWPSVSLAKQHQVGTEWTRCTYTFKAEKNGPYTPVFISTSLGKVNYDAFQLEEGNAATPYAPGEESILGIDLADAPGEIHYLDETLAPMVSVYPPEKGGRIDVTVSDYLDRPLSTFQQDIPAGSKGIYRWSVPFSPSQTGWFRICAQWNGRKAKRDFVVTRKQLLSARPFASVCSMWMDTAILQRLGGGIYATVLNFNTCAAEEGKITIPYKEHRYHLQQAKAAGQLVKIDVYMPPPVRLMAPDELEAMKKYHLAPKRFMPDVNALPAWKQFITELVNQYGDLIDIYEFGGEYDVQIGANPYYKEKYPDKGGHRIDGKPMDNYGLLVAAASEIILKKNPKALITAVRPCDVDCRSGFYFSRGVYSRAKGALNSFGIDNYASPRRIGEGEPAPGPVSDMIWQYQHAKNVLALTGRKDGDVFISEYGYDIWAKDMDRLPYRTQFAAAMAQSLLMARAVGYRHMLYYTMHTRNDHPGVTVTYSNYFRQQPLPSIGTFCNLSRLLDDVTASGYSTPAEGIVAVWFRRSDNSGFGALWNAGFDHDTKVRLAPVKTLDMMGNARELKTVDGKLEFQADFEPLFFEHTSYNELVKILKGAEVMPVSPLEVSCRMASPGVISVNLRSKLRARSVIGEVSFGGRNLRFSANPFIATETLFPCTAKPGENVTIAIRPDGFPQTLTESFTIPALHVVPRVKIPFAMNGSLDKWKALPAMHFAAKELIYPIDVFGWSGKEDLAVDLRLAHDGTYLYVGAEVTDERHCNMYSGGATAAGDIFQIAVHPYRNTSKGKYPHDTNLALALTDKGVQTPVFYYGPSGNILTPGSYHVSRDEARKVTFYEMKLPLAALKLDGASTKAFGFAAVVFDSDTGKRWDYYMNLWPGITMGYVPEKFGVFTLEQK